MEGFEGLLYAPVNKVKDKGCMYILKSKLSEDQKRFMETTLDFCQIRTTAMNHEDCFVYDFVSQEWFTNARHRMMKTEEVQFNDIFL